MGSFALRMLKTIIYVLFFCGSICELMTGQFPLSKDAIQKRIAEEVDKASKSGAYQKQLQSQQKSFARMAWSGWDSREVEHSVNFLFSMQSRRWDEIKEKIKKAAEADSFDQVEINTELRSENYNEIEVFERKRLIKELEKQEISDVLLFTVGAFDVVRQTVPVFILENFGKKQEFKNKKVIIILIDPHYTKFNMLSEQQPFLKKLEEYSQSSLIPIEGSIYTYKFKEYPNIVLKFFGAFIPDEDCETSSIEKLKTISFFSLLHEFFEKHVLSKKIVFIGWMPDYTTRWVPFRLVKTYVDLKQKNQASIFFYGLLWQSENIILGGKNSWIIFDPLESFHPRPLATRFLASYYSLSSISKKNFDASDIRIMNYRSPFVACGYLNFTISLNSDGSMKISLDDNYISKNNMEKYWQAYISNRKEDIQDFFQRYSVEVGKRVSALLAPSSKLDAEPESWKDAIKASKLISLDEYEKIVPER